MSRIMPRCSWVRVLKRRAVRVARGRLRRHGRADRPFHALLGRRVARVEARRAHLEERPTADGLLDLAGLARLRRRAFAEDRQAARRRRRSGRRWVGVAPRSRTRRTGSCDARPLARPALTSCSRRPWRRRRSGPRSRRGASRGSRGELPRVDAAEAAQGLIDPMLSSAEEAMSASRHRGLRDRSMRTFRSASGSPADPLDRALHGESPSRGNCATGGGSSGPRSLASRPPRRSR